MTSEAASILEALDPDQRQIAQALRGPVAVLAGAGTGKTRAITHRIAYGVRTGVYDPQRVLAVTFTRKAAGELQGRLRELGADGVRARTFHGAALAQLSHFWPQFVGGDAPQILPGKVAAISQTVESMGLRLGGETLRDIAAEIEWRKVSLLSMDAYAQQLPNRPALAGVESEKLLDIHEGYTKLLEERRQIDFEDVLVLLSGMLEVEPRAALQVREQYRFFTVDEFQDVSPLQHHVLRLWLGARDDLCVVGDASQTIYSFAGASSSFLLRFGAEYPNAREFKLERNYRSTPPIVVGANRLMRDKPGALQLSPMRPADDAVPQFSWFQTEQDEARAVAQAIAQARRGGTPASDIAVLYRTNAQSARIEEALASEGIPIRVHGAQRFYDRADVRRAILLIRGQAKAGDDRPLFQIVSDMLREVGWTAKPPEGSAERERWEALNSILSLADDMPAGTTIVRFSEELLARQRSQHEPKMEAVTLSAVHAAKGLEWPLVHVVGLSEGIFPISHAQTEQAIEEERRLAYVAFTRARDVLLLSGFASAARVARQPSRFVAEAGVGR
ncbi:ATP-dependent helicase [Leucobacter aridicollis]|uniref:DNA 3'-5' helicase n=1 Tax=Leucobacter aridicollis TaxID=283878 RepID=A0A852RG70_9MICO|nr:ATP-dependent helicase [Leucobacter aridicollis]MBL3681738.1 ATP-dependent helicase [Leucobacter aridicollis]MCS3427952.1 DNA helicase-2/ATP-dependent DNA helicase PcrA [Leucobacter aridicollis]NYD27224.1 DNA helicase-2/ATP-dependent DNA helicase PcrA [Leucobacter aridicollis]